MALTAVQANRLAQVYQEDAQTRNVDTQGMLRELFTMLLQDRSTQKQQLLNLVSRYRARISDMQAQFDATKAAELAALNTTGDQLDDLSTTIPNIN